MVKSHVEAALGDLVSGGLGSAVLTVGLHDLRSLFQSKRFFDSACSPNRLGI